MTTPDSTFACPYCGHPIPPRADQAGGEILCASCQQSWPVPNDARGANAPPVKPPTSAVESRARGVSSHMIVLVTTLLGVGGWLGAFGWSPLVPLGALLGFLVGRTIVDLVSSAADDRGMPAWFPSAHWSLALAVGSWVVAIGFLGLVAQAGWLRGEGASQLLMFFILPVVTVLGLLGGPTAARWARHALRQIRAGERPASGQRLARIALTLSWLMSLALFGGLLWLLAMVYQ